MCPYWKAESIFCSASIMTVAIDTRRKALYCCTEDYDRCPLYPATIPRAYTLLGNTGGGYRFPPLTRRKKEIAMDQKPTIPSGLLRGDEKEVDQHSRAIQKLAQELQLPADEIRQYYMADLDVLKKEARIRAFLPVLVSRSVKARLRHG